MEGEAWMAAEPSPRLGMLVRAVVVEDHVNDLARRDLGLDSVQEADEFLMPVPLHAASDHPAVEHVKRGEQRRGAVPLIVVGHRPASPRLQGQTRLGAVERLDLRFFVDAEHHRVRRRVDIQPNDVTQLGDEFRVARQLELPYPMRLEPVDAPDALHRGEADPGGFGHGGARPMGCLARRIGLGQRDDPLGNRQRQRRNPRRARPVAQQPVDTFVHEPLLPAPQAGLALAGAPHDLVGAEAVGGQQHDPRSPHMLLRAVPGRHDPLKPSTIGGIHIDDDSCAHPTDSHVREPTGIPHRTLPSDLLH